MPAALLTQDYIVKPITNNQMNQLSKSMMTTISKPPIDIQQLVRNCAGLGIKLDRHPDTQVELAYSMLGFRAVDVKTGFGCLVFVGVLDSNLMIMSSFSGGELLMRGNAVSEKDIASFVQASLAIRAQKGIGMEVQSDPAKQAKQVQRLFQNLSKQSEKVLKTVNNQIVAIQEIKSSAEYLTICNKTREHIAQLRQDCKLVTTRQAKLEQGNPNTIALMLQVQKNKEQLQSSLNLYHEVVEKLNDAAFKLATEQGQVTPDPDAFKQQQSFIEYLESVKERKKLDNVRKYLCPG